ncbi:hypothetical protein MRB53_022933 [Persea americana]|uniref:Uncharacterized protein n=1 Tax=Persea americana TaxID=3435 RepID=A0ACC2L839_PERAE|nr:hypothetical protein MRB53_022933 [Persea americana]
MQIFASMALQEKTDVNHVWHVGSGVHINGALGRSDADRRVLSLAGEDDDCKPRHVWQVGVAMNGRDKDHLLLGLVLELEEEHLQLFVELVKIVKYEDNGLFQCNFCAVKPSFVDNTLGDLKEKEKENEEMIKEEEKKRLKRV